MKRKHNMKFAITCILIVLICSILLFFKYNSSQQQEEIARGEVYEIDDVEPYYPEEEDDRHISNVIANPEYIDEVLDVSPPIENIQTLPTAVDDYLQSMGYYNQDLVIPNGGYYQSGTRMRYVFNIGDTGDVLNCEYEIYEGEYNFYIEKAQ